MVPASYLWCMFLIIQLCSCTPRAAEISQQPEGNPFDVGPRGSCMLPQTTYCTDVTYEVPASIARLTEFIEFEIRNIVEPVDDQSVPEECRNVYKETLCRKKFPRCSSEHVHFDPADNCEVQLRENCVDRADSVIKLGYCNSTVFNHSGSCRSLSSSNELQHCNLLERDILVSDWMFEYIRLVDLNLQLEYPLQLLSSQSECWQRYRNFLCSVVGQCVENRVQLINTLEICEAVLNCYSDDFAMVVSDLITCQPWPSEPLHRTVPTIRATENSEQPFSSRSDNYGWVRPSMRTFVFSSSSRTSCTSLFTVAIILILSLYH